MRTLVLGVLWLHAGGCKQAEEPGCVPTVRAAATELAVTTADPLFSEGAVAIGDRSGVDPEAWAASADSLVRFVGNRLYVLERQSTDLLSAFSVDSLTCPIWQVDLPDGANVHDLVEWNDQLVLPAYGLPELLVVQEGELQDSIPVPGAMPALDRAVVVGETLWVADWRFDRSDFATSEGVLLAIDPSGRIEEYPVGPNPRIEAGRTPDELLVATGLYALSADQDGRRRDGALLPFDTQTRTLGDPLVTEADLDADLHGVAVVGSRLVLTSVRADASSAVHCLDSVLVEGPTDPAWFVRVVGMGDVAVVAARASLAGPDVLSDSGLFAVDPVSCARTRDLPMSGSDPYDVAVRPGL